ncbi:CHASE2 domain-containing protein [Oryzifoliimicrobium ureilyticus]|uniref:CHASE2 domain-containing protein n=1 Tax=Oryzifoliimicrobium ureilyticus TaxID=3113724 RepID=UPI0030765C12
MLRASHQLAELRQSHKLLRSRHLRLLIVCVAVFIMIIALSRLPAWELLELRSFDLISTINLPDLPDDAPVIVAIDEPSLSALNVQWPWPRSLHARLIEQLRASGAKAIGLDIIMAEPSTPGNDAAMTAAVRSDVVLAGDETTIPTPQADQTIRALPLADFTAAGAKAGIASIDLSRDGVFRTIPKYDDGFARVLASIADNQAYGNATAALVQTFGPARTYPTVSYYQALDPQNFLPKGIFKDRVVLVGLSLQNAPSIDKGGADAFATAYTVHTGKLVSGVEIQATIFDNLRHNLAIARGSTVTSVLCLLAAIAFAAVTVLRSTGGWTVWAALGAGIVFVAASYLAVRLEHIFISPVAASIAFASVAIGQAAFDYAEERRNKKQITRAFSQYLSPDLVKRLSSDPAQLRLGGERRVLTILFSDVRGFTTIAETLKDDPEQLTTLINRLLTPLSDVVMDHGGTIDKFMGDCIMAFWNAPLDDPKHAQHAVEAALAMQQAIASLNRELEAEAKANDRTAHYLAMGVGINTGECVVGNMGSMRRFDYSCLGDAVNLASRLEGASKNYEVPLLIGEETARQVSHLFNVREVDRIVVKGRTELSPVYSVYGRKTTTI